MKHKMEWRVNTPAFTKELIEAHPSPGALIGAMNIFRQVLAEVAERASEMNDPVLNALMCRLALYGESDPYDKENYNPAKLKKALNSPEYLSYKKSRTAIKKATI